MSESLTKEDRFNEAISKMDLKNYLEKLRALSEQQKKIVLWTIVAIFAVIMGYFWVRETINSFQKIQMPSTNIIQTATPSNENLNK